ncbi:MAG: TonB-dependent receptor plug domain-containing protein, partial [Bacteroidota bacterium]
MKSIKRLLLSALTVLGCVSYSFGQSIIVKDLTTLEAISGASIYITTNNIELPKFVGKTNSEGLYQLSPFSGSALISANGYEVRSIKWSELTENAVVLLVGSNMTLSEMVISATRQANNAKYIAQPVSAIQRKDIQFINPANSADLLTQTSTALVQKSQLGGGSPILRGFEANKVLYVVDGVRMNNAIYRGGHLQDILSLDPMAMESVEIAYGPSAVAYGSDALGGVMSFNTRSPRFTSGDKRVNAGAMLRYSSADQSAAHVNVE